MPAWHPLTSQPYAEVGGDVAAQTPTEYEQFVRDIIEALLKAQGLTKASLGRTTASDPLERE